MGNKSKKGLKKLEVSDLEIEHVNAGKGRKSGARSKKADALRKSLYVKSSGPCDELGGGGPNSR